MRILIKRDGNALVLAVFLLLSLTAVGLVAMKRTGSDLAVTGNLVRANQTWAAGEAGSRQALAHLRSRLWDVMTNLQIQGHQAATLGQASIEKLKEFTTASDAVDPQHLPLVVPGGGGTLATLAKTLQGIAYRVDAMLLASRERHDMPGFEVEEICFEVFELGGQAGVPSSPKETVAETLEGGSKVVVGTRMRAVLGPFKCQLR